MPADLVAVEIIDFLFVFNVCVGVAANLRQRFVAVCIGIDIGVEAV